MSVEHNSNTLIALISMGATWLVAAVGSHVSIRWHVQKVDEREKEHHEDAKELIRSMDKRQSIALASMDKRHSEQMRVFNDGIGYIRGQIDEAIKKQ